MKSELERLGSVFLPKGRIMLAIWRMYWLRVEACRWSTGGGGVWAYKCPTELEAPKEKAVVNNGRGQRVLSNVYCLKQRLETSVAKGSVVAEQCD
jgi:hypothetical protein